MRDLGNGDGGIDILVDRRCAFRDRINRQIGERLIINQNTAANHVRAILQKTGSSNRAEATAYAARHGLLA